MPFQIIRNDITKVAADAIVNTANPDPVYDSGTDGAIYEAAGAEELLAERKKIGVIERGEVAVTPAFKLEAKYIIHTVGPAWEGGSNGEFEVLKNCYHNSLVKALELGCESIAFPLIATGVYGFPKDKALQTAISVFSEFLSDHEMQIILVVFDQKSFEVSGQIFTGIDAFIDENYVSEHIDEEYGGGDAISHASERRRRKFGLSSLFSRRSVKDESVGSLRQDLYGAAESVSHKAPSGKESSDLSMEEEDQCEAADESCDEPVAADRFMGVAAVMARPVEEGSEKSVAADFFMDAAASVCMNAAPQAGIAPQAAHKKTLDEVVSHLSETWQESLFRLIDEKGYSDVAVYKNANVDRKLFSKIRSNKDYQPKKITAVAFALALNLNLDDTKDFLRKAGFALSESNLFDVIIEYFIENEVYDIYTINIALFDHDQPTIGA